MGGFYGSIHFRNIDRPALLRETELLAAERGQKFLVGPELNGWTAVYPDHHGQDASIAAALAKALNAEVLHLIVHDDDIFAYGCYRGTRLVDEYNSSPDYFGNVSAAKKARLRGNVESLREVVGSGPDLAAVKALLGQRHNAFPFEVNRLAKFAEIVGLENAVTTYEYLVAGERRRISGWELFVPVPDDRAEKRAVVSALREKKAELKRQGILLTELQPPRAAGANAQHASATWCLDPAKDRVWHFWRTELPNIHDTVPLYSWSPGEDSVAAIDWPLPATATSLECSPSGRWLAVGSAYGNWSAELWDRSAGTRRFVAPHARSVEQCTFLCDESRLLQSGSGELVLTSIPDGTRLVSNKSESGSFGRAVAVHPSQRWIVAPQQHGELQILDADTLETNRVIITHRGLTRDPASLPALMEKLLATGMAPREVQAAFARQANPEAFATVVFSSDGTWLCTGSTRGLRVYRWSDLITLSPEASHAPAPTYSVDARPNAGSRSPGTYCYAIAVDNRGQRVLFAGLEGIVESLDLTTGRVSTLLDPPERLAILRMDLSASRELLVIHAREMIPNSPRPAELTIWSYPRLRKPLD